MYKLRSLIKYRGYLYFIYITMGENPKSDITQKFNVELIIIMQKNTIYCLI